MLIYIFTEKSDKASNNESSSVQENQTVSERVDVAGGLIDSHQQAKPASSGSQLLDIDNNLQLRSQIYKKRGMRYRRYEKDIKAFEFMKAGNSFHEYQSLNKHCIHQRTLRNHITKSTIDITEGVLLVKPLAEYLSSNGYCYVVSLSEDASSLVPRPTYDPTTDNLSGLVPPFDENGMPEMHHFTMTSATKMADVLKTYPIGNLIYMILATPMQPGASPFCIYYACANNNFDSSVVLRRWNFVEQELLAAGISVISNCSDGDPRLLKAMVLRSGLNDPIPNLNWGRWFIAPYRNSPVCIQDTVHLVNKIRHSYVNPKKRLVIGKLIFFFCVSAFIY